LRLGLGLGVARPVLAVYVAADLNGCLKLEQRRLSCQDCCTLLKQIRELVSAQVHVGARFLCHQQCAASGRQAGNTRTGAGAAHCRERLEAWQ